MPVRARLRYVSVGVRGVNAIFNGWAAFHFHFRVIGIKNL